MNKRTSIALILVLGGIGIYHLTKKPTVKNFDSNTINLQKENTTEITKEIVEDYTKPNVQSIYPNFGKPLRIEQSNFANYVDTKHNEFFQPQIGTFKP
jgi:hypothetical protein